MVNNETLKQQLALIYPKQVDFLTRLCSIDSGSQDEEGIKKMVETIIHEIDLTDYTVEVIEEKGYGSNLVIRVHPQATKKIVLSAHMDTVFAKGDVLKHPVTIKDDVLYGLGSSDCKGGIMVSLYSVILAQKLGILHDDIQYVLMYTCDEEIGSPTAKKAFSKELDASYALVFEPSRENKGILTSRRTCLNAIVEVFGKTAHSANFTSGHSAVVGLSNIIQKINELHDPARNIFINVNCLQSAGKINQVCDYAQMEISCRVSSKEEGEEYKEKYLSLAATDLAGCSCKINVFPLLEIMEANEKNRALFNIAKEAGKRIGLELTELSSAGSGDASYFSSNGVATIDALGTYTYDMHNTNEHTLLESFSERTALAINIIDLLD